MTDEEFQNQRQIFIQKWKTILENFEDKAYGIKCNYSEFIKDFYPLAEYCCLKSITGFADIKEKNNG